MPLSLSAICKLITPNIDPIIKDIIIESMIAFPFLDSPFDSDFLSFWISILRLFNISKSPFCHRFCQLYHEHHAKQEKICHLSLDNFSNISHIYNTELY